MSHISDYSQVSFITITEASDGQRIDNFLLKELKFLPKTAIYKLLRKGEIRVDKKRVKPVKKLVIGEVVRIAPIRDVPDESEVKLASHQLLARIEAAIVLEDDDLIIINKPSGIAVHGGTDNLHGVIEVIRQLRPDLEFIELVHRIDKETSGLLLLAKNRLTLLGLHEAFKTDGISKHYQTLVFGNWRGGERRVSNHLQRSDGKSGPKMHVTANEEGKFSESVFSPIQQFEHNSLLSVKLLTGRMHQIRTQLAELELPIVGDSKYGDFALNRDFARNYGLKRLFLHAYRVEFKLEHSGKIYRQEIPLTDDLKAALSHLDTTIKTK